MSLFRKEVLSAKQNEFMGQILLMRPVSFAWLTALTIAIGFAIVAFFAWGEYTKRARVTGHLMPTQGVAKVYARESSTVRERHVQEGQPVRKGDVMFVLATERVTADGLDASAQVSDQLTSRRQALLREQSALSSLKLEQAHGVERRLREAELQRDQARAELALQQSRQELAVRGLERSRQLAEQGFISPIQIEQKQGELLAEQSRTQSLQRGVASAEREIAALKAEQRELPIRAQAEQATVARSLAALGQERVEHDTRREIIVRAPQDGVVTAIQADVGHAVPPSLALASLVPQGSELQAQLYAPSRAVGFIEPGREVQLRYQPFPYQKFGQYKGTVMSVSRTALAPADAVAAGFGEAREPVYRITVALAQQHVDAYGASQPLQAGTQLEADIMLDKRRLIEWVFEPLFSLTKKV